MFFKTLLNCVIVLAVTLCNIEKCSSERYNQRLPDGSVAKPSPIIIGGEKKINVKNVTFSDKNDMLINHKYDKSQNNREFPSSARHKRNSDNPYHGIDIDIESLAASGVQENFECILSRSEFYLSWWVNEDGSLKLPASIRDGSSMGFVDLSFKYQSEALIFEHVSQLQTDNPNDVITFMSMASNELKRLPIETLEMVSITLQYLSLANNDLNRMFDLSEPLGKLSDRIISCKLVHELLFLEFWEEFPWLKSLKELDLRNCSLTVLEPHFFEKLLGLEKLFLSHNMLSEVTAQTFINLKSLKHLDLSYQEVLPSIGMAYGVVDPFSKLFTGLYLEDSVFSELESLIFLDLSHTKLKQESVRALQLRNKIEQLSLCYTDLPMIAPEMFVNTNLKVLDLSGNPGLASSMNWTWFSGLEKTLEIFVFENSNIKNIEPLSNLQKLRMLSLGLFMTFIKLNICKNI